MIRRLGEWNNTADAADCHIWLKEVKGVARQRVTQIGNELHVFIEDAKAMRFLPPSFLGLEIVPRVHPGFWQPRYVDENEGCNG